jgi:hypothetical protein
MSLWERAVGGYASAVEESGGALTRGAANRYLSAKAGECGDAEVLVAVPELTRSAGINLNQ